MNTFGKVLLYGVGIVAIYSLAVTFLKAPVLGGGSLIFLLLLACPLMMLFMHSGGSHDHGQSTDEKKPQATHQHQH